MVEAVPHGLARYVKNLVHGLAEVPQLPYEPVLLISEKGRGQFPGKFETVELAAPFLNPREWWEIPRALRKLEPALFHAPSFSSLPWSPCPWIITIHDLNHRHFGGWKEKLYYEVLLRRFARSARKIMTVSEFSRTEISEWLGIEPSAIEVVYNAIDPALLGTSADRSRRGEYFLFLSHHDKPHKNSLAMLQAYADAKRKSPSLPDLILNATQAESSSFARAIPGVVFAGRIPDTELPGLIRHSRALLYPSLYEGFGLPPLEAAVLGADVLVSDIPPHREALADFSSPQVRWLELSRPESWSDVLLEAARSENPPIDAARVSRALARFSVRRLAEHMDQIYRSVLEL